MIYKRQIYIAVTLLLQLELKNSPVPTDIYRTMAISQEKAPWVGPKKGSWVKILRPESYWLGNPQLGLEGWRANFRTRSVMVGFAIFIFLHWCFIGLCVPWKFPVRFLFGHYNLSPLRCFFSSYSTSKCIMYDLFLPNISYGSRF